MHTPKLPTAPIVPSVVEPGSAPSCEKPGSRWSTCLAYLADGWITPSDLCPACIRAFMVALDGIAGPLTWHPGYRKQAESRTVSDIVDP